MLISPIPTPLMQELSAGHALAMQCGARASQFLDRAAAAGWDERANLEALRMAGLTARLMDGVQRIVPRVRRPAAAASASVLASRPAGAASAVLPATSVPKRHAASGQRRGCLKNGNPSGDYLLAPRCGARTRAGCACRQPAMANGRCRMHGGLSTGPRTPEGLARSRAARLTHGYRTRELIGLRSRAAHAARRLRGLNRALSAGHGVHRSDSIDASRGVARTDVRTDCGPAPTNGADRTRPAGHGVHRSDSINRKDAKLVLGPAKGWTRGAQSNRAISSSASSRLCGESTVRNGTVSAGHGLHRSFRDSLRSSVAGAA